MCRIEFDAVATRDAAGALSLLSVTLLFVPTIARNTYFQDQLRPGRTSVNKFMNTINALLRSVTRLGFLSSGWLLVAWLPLAQTLGRAVFSVLGAVFLAWGYSNLYIRRPQLDPLVLAIYATMLLLFAAGIPYATDRAIATHRWIDFFLYSSASLLVVNAMHSQPDTIRLARSFAASATISLAVLLIVFLFRARQPDFQPERDMREDNLPFLLPFVLYWIQCHSRWRAKPLWVGLALLTVFSYVIGSHGRAALLGLTLALATYAVLVARLRLIAVVAIVISILGGAFLLRGAAIYHQNKEDSSLSKIFDRASSHRTELWSNAIANPPRNIWLGSGMGNIPESVLTVEPATPNTLGHLHNFVLDCWYETGFCGLSALLLWLGLHLRRGFANWRLCSTEVRSTIGTYLSASFGILFASLFSYSYGSKQFALYLFVFLSVAAVKLEPNDSNSQALTSES